MNSECFLKEDDLELAKEVCKYIEKDTARNNAVANYLAVDMAKQILDDDNIDFESGLYHIDEIQEKFDMSDIYINGSCVCVRYCIDNKIYIPKAHFEYGVNPVAYMCIQPNTDFSGGILKGFLASANIDKSIEENDFYVVSEDNLISYYDLEPMLLNYEEEPINKDFYINAFDFIDKKNCNAEILFKTLTKNKDSRIYLKDLSDSKKAFNYISLNETSENNIMEEPVNLDAEQNTDELGILEENVPAENLTELDESFSEELFLADDSDNGLVINDLGEDLLENTEVSYELEESSPSTDLEVESEDFSDEIQEYNNPELQIDTEINLDESLMLQEDETNTLEENINMESEENSILEETSDSIPEENSSNNYETIVTPSLDFEDDEDSLLEENTENTDEINDISTQEDYEQINDADFGDTETQLSDTESPMDNYVEQEEMSEVPQEEHQDENQIQELFDDSSEIGTVIEESFTPKPKKKKNLAPLLILFIVVGLASAGYYGYQRYSDSNNKLSNLPETDKTTEVVEEAVPQQEQKEEAMPIETVEKVETPKPVEEGLNVSIPAIEKNLDASIMVSNLSINWEVPSNYITNSSAKRYFVKIGKIIQLNLKTELLLLNKMPITNKITVELTYNKDSGHFEIKDMPLKSGEQVIDDTIKTTVSNVLKMNLNINTSSFANTPGNPVLVIHL